MQEIHYSTIALYEALQAGEGQAFAPRFAPEDIQRFRTDPNFSRNLERAVQEAEGLMGTTAQALPFSLYRQFDESGDRSGYEQRYFDHRHRLNAFAILAMIYPEKPEYLTWLEDTIWAICDEYTWSVPAHLIGGGSDVRVPRPVYNGQGRIDYAGNQHWEQLDLFACETSFALSEITTLLEDRLAPLVVYRARTECWRRILSPYLELHGLWKWEKGTNNWSAVCAGSIGATALYLIDDSSTLTPIIQRLLATLDGYLSGLCDEGTCVEGVSYWRYGMSFFCGFAELLRSRTAGRVDLLAIEKARRIAEYQQKCYLTGNHVASFSDATERVNFRLGLAAFLRQEYDTVRVPNLAYAAPVLSDGSNRWCNDYRDFYWARHFNFQNDPPEPRRVYLLREAQQFIGTLHLGERTVCLAAKGGHNGEPHNHNDVGSVIYHIDGDSLLIDLGRGRYCKQYFGPERYNFITNGSQGHSLPIVAGGYQQPGREHAATLFEMEETGDCYRLQIGLEKAYNEPRLQSLRRSLRLDKQTGELTVNDRCESSEPLPFTSRFVTKCQVLVQGDRVWISGGHACAELCYDPALCTLAVSEDYMEPHNSAAGSAVAGEPNRVFLIDLTVKSPAARQAVTVTLRPAAKPE